MANRTALRELQTRLAGRLQAAREETVLVSWLAVRAGPHKLLFPLAQAGEIFMVTHIASVPYARDWFEGVVSLRGGLFGVVDVAGFLAAMLTPGVPFRARPLSALSSLVTFNEHLDLNCALLVDGLVGLRREDSFVSQQAPAEDMPDYYGNLFVDASGVPWQEIKLQTLSQCSEFLGIGIGIGIGAGVGA